MNDTLPKPVQTDVDPTVKPIRLSRALGLTVAVAVVVGNVIGSGVFLKPTTIARDGGNFGLIMSVWVLGGVLCVLGALCFAELATMLPRAGGLYVYLREAYGRPVAFLFGWTEFAVRVPGSIAALSVVFVGQLMYVLGIDAPPAVEVLVVIVVIVLLAWVNIIGVLWGGRMNLATTLIKALVLALVAFIPFLLIPLVDDGVRSANYLSTVEPASMSLTTQVAAVLLAVMWAYNGWHGITPLAEEIRRPRRNIPLALFGGIGLLILLYVSANLAYHGVLSMDEMSAIASHNEAAGNRLIKETAGSEMFRKLIGPPGAAAMAWVIMFSTFGAICTNMLQTPRISFAMGRDGVFFRSLGQVHATYRTPAVAICVTALMSIGMILAAAVAKYLVQGVSVSPGANDLVNKVVTSLKQGTIFDLLTDFVIFSASLFYTLTALAVIVLRIRRPELKRPYRTWGYPVVPLVFVVVYIWFLWQVYRDKPLEAHTGLVLIGLGIPIYFAYQWWSKRKP